MLDLHRLGELLHDARMVAGLTQADLAARAGVRPSYISMLESGQRNVTLATLDAVVSALGRELVISVEQPMTPAHRELLRQLQERVPTLDPAFLVTLEILVSGWENVHTAKNCQENVKAG